MDNHQIIRDNIRPGDILLSRKKHSPISKIIGGITKSHWSHTFMILEEDKILESNRNGVVINHLSYYLNQNYDVGLFRVRPKLTEEETKKLIKEARKLLGIKYGWLQLIWQWFLRLIKKSEDKDWAIDVDKGMVCSEMVAEAYQRIGKPVKDLPPEQMEPVDFDESLITVRIA